jgi:hypothetical protein
VRTLIVGFPLPHVNFDNHSFLSAPSFSEYQRIVVDLASVSRAVDEVVNGTAVHTTYGGQAVVNGEASPHAFPLADLLAMRRREAEWVLSHGGLFILVAYPQVPHADVSGASWRSYGWLPEPEGFSFASDILPGFGRPGAVLVDGEHAFAPFVRTLGERLAYRAYVNEEAPALAETGHVFARSEGGIPIAFDVRDGEGTLVFLPTVLRPDSDRPVIAESLIESLDRWDNRNTLTQGPNPESATPEFSQEIPHD